jgi:hypothetical protein
LAQNLPRRQFRPVAQKCGNKKTIGWHTFRHSYATHLKANGEDVKVVQEFSRHANSRITLRTWTNAPPPTFTIGGNVTKLAGMNGGLMLHDRAGSGI